MVVTDGRLAPAEHKKFFDSEVAMWSLKWSTFMQPTEKSEPTLDPQQIDGPRELLESEWVYVSGGTQGAAEGAGYVVDGASAGGASY